MLKQTVSTDIVQGCILSIGLTCIHILSRHSFSLRSCFILSLCLSSHHGSSINLVFLLPHRWHLSIRQHSCSRWPTEISLDKTTISLILNSLYYSLQSPLYPNSPVALPLPIHHEPFALSPPTLLYFAFHSSSQVLLTIHFVYGVVIIADAFAQRL